ncbi:MAG TPA: protein kinase [Vicinamibacterales bacterium]|nr:protein kinase [Vicinamibacterales bacterium]
MQTEVESLLNAHEQAGIFAEGPAVHNLASACVGHRLQHGDFIGPYQITDFLAAGGMGEVYRARDSKLGRDVAIKILPALAAGDSGRQQRFEREARILAALNHPNIGAIYGFEQTDGVLGLVLELVEGPTLADRVAVARVPIHNALTIARQLADALEAAHAKGVIHRDLKPANIKVTATGVVKVLDFGLAKVWADEASGLGFSSLPVITSSGKTEGAFLGTAAYMSPEQACGRALDPRTDIWAFGCVLYEMLAGRAAFVGDTILETAAKILEREPDWAALPADVPAEIRALLVRCLEKDLGRRLTSPTDAKMIIDEAVLHGSTMQTAAREAPRRPSTRRIRAIAVLPLVNLSRDPGQEYFTDGMTDALITELSRIGALKVVSRTSVTRFKDTKKPLRDIARELGVDGIVQGSVLRVDDRVRITAQLIHAATDGHVWAESYERELRDILRLQSEVAQAVAREVHVSVKPAETQRLMDRRRVEPESYEAYLKGMFHLRQFTPQGFEKSLTHLYWAVDKNPQDALAWAGLALAHAMISHNDLPPHDPHQAFARVKAAAERALALDRTVAEAHLAVAELKLYYEWDWPAAEQAFKLAFKFNPLLGEAHRHHAWYSFVAGTVDQTIAGLRRAIEIEPLSPLYTAELGWVYWALGRRAEAITETRKSLQLSSQFPVGLFVHGQLLREEGRTEEAVAAHQQAAAASPGFIWALGETYALVGRSNDARAIIAPWVSGSKPNNAWDAFAFAVVSAALGETDQAFRGLEAAYEYRHSWFPAVWSFRVFAPLLNDQRFQELLHRMHLPPTTLDVIAGLSIPAKHNS